jgi:hypothetical protein
MAQFLIDASMPRPTASLLARYGHTAVDVRDIGMGSAPDPQIAAHAQMNQLILLSKDQDFGNVLDYPPDQYFGIAVIDPPAHGGRSVVLALVEQLLRQKDIIDALTGRLAVIQAGRIRLRPTP